MSLDVDNVTISFGDQIILESTSLHVPTSQTVAICGPSGAGKSTLLRLIAGLLQPQSGRILIDDLDVTTMPTHQRSVGMVFQDNQLFPHLDVRANIAFGLRMTGAGREQTTRRVDELLSLVGLDRQGRQDVMTLSGGEAKRVALARALAPKPKILLLDEPLTGLDAELHDRLALDLRQVLSISGTTAVLVTHNVQEAHQVADRVEQLR